MKTLYMHGNDSGVWVLCKIFESVQFVNIHFITHIEHLANAKMGKHPVNHRLVES